MLLLLLFRIVWLKWLWYLSLVDSQLCFLCVLFGIVCVVVCNLSGRLYVFFLITINALHIQVLDFLFILFFFRSIKKYQLIFHRIKVERNCAVFRTYILVQYILQESPSFFFFYQMSVFIFRASIKTPR